MSRSFTGMLLCLLAFHAEAALQSRLAGQAYYDTTLNITWVADANLSQTSTYDADGMMTWAQALAWIAALNAAQYLGASDWRLPATVQPDPTCSLLDANGQSFGLSCSGSELGHLYYVDGVTPAAPAPFVNVHANYYWSGTVYAPNPPQTWSFDFSNGIQVAIPAVSSNIYALAVTPGDIDADGDGVSRQQDNCTAVANAGQRDDDSDGYGNICDPDFNNDGTVNINDFNRLKSRLGITPVTDLVTDLDGNGAVNVNDLNRLKSFLGKPPGPSGLHPNCPPTCP